MIGLNTHEAAVILSWKACHQAGTARQLYRQARRGGLLAKLRAGLAGKPGHLLELEQVKGRRALHGRTDAGLQTVAIEQIRGSEEPCHDLDAAFRPVGDESESRWLRVAADVLAGEPMPPVSLIQVGDVYFVRDGHYQVSVARALGQLWVEAEVVVWHLAGLLPADEKAAAHRRESASRSEAARAKEAGVV